MAFARQRLQPEDQIALEATTNTWAVVALLRPFVARIVVANPLRTRAIAEAKLKTDKIDAEALAQLLRCDYLPPVWQPDQRPNNSGNSALSAPASLPIRRDEQPCRQPACTAADLPHANALRDGGPPVAAPGSPHP